MKKLFEEYGSVIVVVIAIVALITLVITLMQPSGPMGQAFDGIIQSFVDKTTGAIGGEGGAGGSGDAGQGGSGGSGENVRYVTFMNGDVELYKMSVDVGNDCVDVLTNGLISTPTKTSTAEHDYTYCGWGASDNGTADASILQNITENKTVYAIYTAEARLYTITFYDDDGTTVLATKQVAYGTKPSYAPTKEGYAFMGWTPALANVTGDASYTASWVECVTLLDTTRLSITEYPGSISVPAFSYKVGDKFMVEWDGTTYTTEVQYVEFRYPSTFGWSGKSYGIGNPYKMHYTTILSEVATQVRDANTQKTVTQRSTPPFWIKFYANSNGTISISCYMGSSTGYRNVKIMKISE